MPHERLQKARQDRGFATPSEAAEAFGWVQVTYIQHENGTREVSKEAAPKYAQAFGVTAGWILWGEPIAVRGRGPKIRLAGRIGAGQEVRPIDDGFDSVELNFPEASEAFEVCGDSMLPVARDGDLVVASAPRPLRDVIGTECVVDLEDGRRFFKTVERGSAPNLFTLLSYNAEPLRDVRVAAAGPLLAVKRR